ncbi:hypothetical protein BSKO_06190 [Bryopsis sp. KO-2023]|nr:hypothetical protein BSKO_06190 [Bryopsis sp. KO-2023]
MGRRGARMPRQRDTQHTPLSNDLLCGMASGFAVSGSGAPPRLRASGGGLADNGSSRHVRVRSSGGSAIADAKSGQEPRDRDAQGLGFDTAVSSTSKNHTVDSVSSFQTWDDDNVCDGNTSPRSMPGSQEGNNVSPKLVVFSGGTAFNSIAGKLMKFTTSVSHILPVSDDGGSTAEIVRVLGGPAVGDIRSRCLRLADDSDSEARAVRRLLGHRLPTDDGEEAKREWYSIVEGCHPLWDGVSEPYKHTIRAFLVYFHSQILRHVTQMFDFRNGSVGNFFFAGARLFFRSLDAAIFLFARVARIPEGSQVLPAIQTEERITLGAELEDGTFLRGQNEISHPTVEGKKDQASVVDKLCDGPVLPSPIQRVFYMSSEGTNREHEVFLPANRMALSELERADTIIYGMGSLYTSICPSLILDGMGEVIASRTVPKILILNGRHDRETSACRLHDGPMRATDVAQAVVDALNRQYAGNSRSLDNPTSAYITAMLVPRGGFIPVDMQGIEQLGVGMVLEVESVRDGDGDVLFDPEALVQAIDDVMAKQNQELQM